MHVDQYISHGDCAAQFSIAQSGAGGKLPTYHYVSCISYLLIHVKAGKVAHAVVMNCLCMS
jgi:hypothetical protein